VVLLRQQNEGRGEEKFDLKVGGEVRCLGVLTFYFRKKKKKLGGGLEWNAYHGDVLVLMGCGICDGSNVTRETKWKNRGKLSTSDIHT